MENPIVETPFSKKKRPNHCSDQRRMTELSSIIKELNSLCSELDPYQPLSNEMKKSLSKYGVFDEDNPFVITNKLVFILENSVEELIGLGGTP